MAKNLDHSTSSSKPTSKRQSFENSVERFLERHHLAGNPAESDEQLVDATDEAIEEGAAAHGPVVEVEIVDPIEKTMEAPMLVVDEDEEAIAQDYTPEQDMDADPIESTMESPFLVIPGEEDVYDGDPLVDGEPIDGYADEYYDDGYYDDGYYYDDYEEPTERRGVRRGVVAALVACVAIASFVAGGVAVRFFLQTPAAPVETPAPVEMQASLTEKTDQSEDKVTDEELDRTTKKKNTTTTTDDTKSDTKQDISKNTDTKNNTNKKNNDTSTTTNAPSYDTGDDTTDDSDSSSSKKKTDTQDNEWRWNLDDDGSNSISYDRDDQEMTVDYDGYKLTVPMGDLVDEYEQTYGDTTRTYGDTNRTYRNNNTRDDSGYRGYDYGRDGSGTEWTRNRTERDYSRTYGNWS